MTALRPAPLPFEEVFAGLVEHAGRPLSWHSLLAPAALASVRRDLTLLLSGISARPLLAAFTVFGECHGLKPTASNDPHREFVSRMREGGLEHFFAEYPVLSRLAEMCVRDWSAAIEEFVSRLNSDRADLVRAFGVGAAGRVADLEPALSDRHRGRTVMAVTFDSGLKLVYKPRDMALEQSYFDLLGWLNHHGSPADHRIPQMLAKPGYGWVEWVAHDPCRNQSEIRDYFVQAGALQCILYVLHSTDAHMGNIIAAGPRPVLVDAECLVQPRWHPDGDTDPDRQDMDDLLLAGLLPQPRLLRGEEVDLSGLTGEEGQPTNFRVPLWLRVNTDAVSLQLVQGVLSSQKNQPWWNGGPAAASAHTAEFLRGFGEMYRCLAGRVPDLMAPDGPLAPLFSCHPRVLLDHTRRYLSLLNRSLHPRYLRDDTRRLALLHGELSPYRPAPILQAEIEALTSLNVPYFSAHARGVSLSSEGRMLIPSYFAASGEAVVRARLEGMSEADRENRTSVVRMILAMSLLEI